MDFEFDPAKSGANKAKHGIDFVEAQALWLDADLLELPSAFEGEIRVLAIGRIGEICWTAIFAYRGPHIRLISVRRSRKEEVAIYEG